MASNLDLREIFSEANTAFTRTGPLATEVSQEFLNSVVRSSIAKCLDFNTEAQNLTKGPQCFFLMSASRAMCEELIYAAFFCLQDSSVSRGLAVRIAALKHHESIRAQTRFFAKNNPFQPTIGVRTGREQDQDVAIARDSLQADWRKLGYNTIPSTQRLAKAVGLETTYGYLYHMSSNFVHFNPGQLMKLGWGPMEGPFVFSVAHFSRYYAEVCRFVGALLFFGYCCTWPCLFAGDFPRKYTEVVTGELKRGVRWPEIVTFEEMNISPPKNPLARALISVVRQDNRQQMPEIFSEFQALQKRKNRALRRDPPPDSGQI